MSTVKKRKRKVLKIKSSLVLIGLLISAAIQGQIAPEKYFVPFTNKANTPYQISSPSDFLSHSALLRRARQNIQITEQDLPVNPEYIAQVLAQGNIKLLYPLKWFNGVVIETTDTSALDNIGNLPFVKPDFQRPFENIRNRSSTSPKLQLDVQQSNALHQTDYGAAQQQTDLMNLKPLHQQNYRGHEMHIGIFDSGFQGADTLLAFEKVFREQRVMETFDLVDGGEIKYNTHSHGMYVWSCMVSDLPFLLVGTAPDADYSLFRTEDVASEYILEEFNWVAAAEKADSLGVDIINTSLGYTEFDDSTMNHTYEDMDGQSTPAAVGANIAASKGMLVVVSAGNSGGSPWRYISTPSDADHALCVGAVDDSSQVSNFSSRGFSADGDVKPNVVAHGQFSAVWNYGDEVANVNGTSFSSPITAGAAASLWSANRDMSSFQIKNAIERSAHLYENPNEDYGYGLPDFEKAHLILQDVRNGFQQDEWVIYPNPSVYSDLTLGYLGKENIALEVEIFNSVGQLVRTVQNETEFRQIRINASGGWAPGNYVVMIRSSDKTIYKKWVKLR